MTALTARAAVGSATVTVVVPTHNRPGLVLEAARSVFEQDYEGFIETIVVFDQSAPHPVDVADTHNRRLRLVVNDGRTPGLAGARNTGILASTCDFIAFCDDDDAWLPSKLSAQLGAMARHGRNDLVVSTGICVVSENRTTRRPGPDRTLGFGDFLNDRIMEVNPCTLLFPRTTLVDEIGLVDEAIPGSYAEDYELVLRTARNHPVLHVAEPLVRIAYHRGSYYSSHWQTIIDGLEYLLDRYPEFEQHRHGHARVLAQIAFANAALGHRAGALGLARRSLRRNPFERRAWVSLAVILGLPASFVVDLARRVGRGI